MKHLDREQQTLETMIALYCHNLHAPDEGLCPDCTALRDYARARLEHCTYGTDKPKCSACPIHCYKPAMREAIRTVMRYAGPRMLLRHPLLALGHVMKGKRAHPPKKRQETS